MTDERQENVDSGQSNAELSAPVYDAAYYLENYTRDEIGASLAPPYRRGEPFWEGFFDLVADGLVEELGSRSVLDVGCAIGFLVEKLRKRGVDARGIDISEWAISQVSDELRPYCTVASLTDELAGHYDLITCIEVLEHMEPHDSVSACANICRHTDTVVFSSTPNGFHEVTHLNVQSGDYWVDLFARNGFFRDLHQELPYIAPYAILFRRRDWSAAEVASQYERAWYQMRRSIVGVRETRDRFDHELTTLRQELGHLDNPHEDLLNQSSRHQAERLAALRATQDYEASQRRLASLVAQREQQLQELQGELAAFRQTKTYRYTELLRRMYGVARRKWSRPPTVPLFHSESAQTTLGSYQLWIEQYDTIDDSTRTDLRRRLGELSRPPVISVLIPVYNTGPAFLRAALDSVLAQLYPHWELCIADDGSTAPHIQAILTEYSALDPRVKVVRRTENGHISAASNTALELASGEWVACLDHDDVLPEHALALAALTMDEHPEAGLVYSDEDKLDGNGQRYGPYFKPEFDPLLLLGQNYLAHLCLMRRQLVDEVGGYRVGYEGSQDWDLILRVVDRLRPDQVVHIPHVLYHWRAHPGSTASRGSVKPYAPTAGRQAVQDHLARQGLDGEVMVVPAVGHHRVKWRVPNPAPLVSIVIPTKDGAYLGRCIDSLLAYTTYPKLELVVVDNGSETFDVLRYLAEREDVVRVIRDESPFNCSALNNMAVERSSGDVICLLNDDIEITSGDWLDEMVGQLSQPGVGAVGALLCYDKNRVQHAGILLGIGGVAGHAHHQWDPLSLGYFGRLHLAQTFSAVTGTCMAVRREAWNSVGGLDADHLALAFNDVDFGLRLREAGWRVVWTPFAMLVHHESVTRGFDTDGERAQRLAGEARYMQVRWHDELRSDPAYNPNLTLNAEDFSLAWPPRTSYR